ncbi:ABC transporter substrate-binding protein [Mycetocola zhujimingii]|uniref:ABC transporter substrate-binding protein n=1 Tax=Mycetocola zhujimingii TaxID=2079792 RepID=A0A2U1TC56_9MICO|nr:ABC transporter substrate-binding protein [Mycetocola zhujimingii]PWC06475.1 ABC transporter substrate-binding protein [Mycetocola zhujimingii]
MSQVSRSRKSVRAVGLMAAAAIALTGCSGGGGGGEDGTVELTWLQGSGVQTNIDIAQSLVDAFEAENPDIKIKVDSSGGAGSEYDNLLKTRLATGEVGDMFWYNSGSQLQGLNPDQTLLNVADEPWVEDLDETFRSVVSGSDGAVFGAPAGSAGTGGILYNVPVYEELGLEVPTTWDEFVSNSDAIKAAGKTAVQMTFADTWTAQILTLSDFYNVYKSDPEWADKYTANEAKFATDPVAVEGFTKLQELADGGYFNADFASATLDEGLVAVASGEAGHYPMFTALYSTLKTLAPDDLEDIGYFSVPGDDAADNGGTVWYPAAVYAPKDTEHPEAVKKFMAFVASPAGCDAVIEASGVTGPMLVDGCELPEDAPRMVTDMYPYFDEERVAPALEFLSPIKGPALEQLLVEVGSGIRSAEDAAALYDQDVEKQAQQLGLDGW